MANKSITSDEIFEQTMKNIAPLPCQEGYARNLASILSVHLHKNMLMDEGFSPDDLPSMSTLVVAPTGQGKTYLIRKMSECLGLNTIVVDCSTLAAEGWKGVGLSQRLLTAQAEAKDKKAFARSILFLDELDKLRFWGTTQDQANPMSNILQLFNAGYVTGEGHNKEAVSIDIRRFTILMGGAFEGLDTIVRNRIYTKASIGFDRTEGNSKKRSKAELMQQVTMEDLTAYGMMPELLGRIGMILTIPPMELQDYRKLLSADTGSIQTKFNNYLKGLYGVIFEITESGTEAIAKKCMESRSGARAVNPLVNDLMCRAISEVERDDAINKVILDAGEFGYCIGYEHGERRYCYLASNSPEHSVCTIKATSTSGFARRLCRYYRNAGGDMVVHPELEAFLDCALMYLKEYTREEEFCFESLEKLARTVQRDHHRRSTFETMLLHTPIYSSNAYTRFKEYYHDRLQLHLVSALQLIANHLMEKNGNTKIQFAFK